MADMCWAWASRVIFTRLTCFEDSGVVTEVSITEESLDQLKHEEWLYEVA